MTIQTAIAFGCNIGARVAAWFSPVEPNLEAHIAAPLARPHDQMKVTSTETHRQAAVRGACGCEF